MSKRLQILLPDAEMAEIRRMDRRERITVGEWVQRALRQARFREAAEVERKLKVTQDAATYSFPTADNDQMLDEIERGYLE